MKLSQVREYTEGVLKKWFPTKKTILDKLNKNEDGFLTFDGEQVARFESVNLYKENILPTPLVITVAPSNSTGLSVSFTTQLSEAIEDYAWAVMKCHWTTKSGEMYYHTHNIHTRNNGESQWISQYWSSSSNTMTSNNGMVIGVQGKKFDVKFSDLEEGTITIDEIIGYKLREVTDGTAFAHEHSSLETLELLSHNGDVLNFNNKPVNTTSYKKVLWQESSTAKVQNSSSSATYNVTISLTESALNYDATVFYFRLKSGSTVYEHTDTNYIVKTGTNLWFSKMYGPTQRAYGNYTINSAGNIVLTNLGQDGFSSVEIYKIEGIKYGTK